MKLLIKRPDQDEEESSNRKKRTIDVSPLDAGDYDATVSDASNSTNTRESYSDTSMFPEYWSEEQYRYSTKKNEWQKISYQAVKLVMKSAKLEWERTKEYEK